MPAERPRTRRTGRATTRTAIRRETRRSRTDGPGENEGPETTDATDATDAGDAAENAENADAAETAGTKDRWRFLRAPATWLATVLVAAAAVTFQDVLVGTAKTVLPVEALPDALSPEDAVEVVETKDVKEYGEYLVRDGSRAQLGRELTSGGWFEERRGVVDVGRSEWMVTLRGQASQQVRITDIVPELVGGGCAAPLGGRLVYAPSQGGSEVIPLEVDIDDRVPRLKAYKKDRPYFTGPQGTHITLKQNETEAFYIIAKSRGPYCRWRYRMHYEVGGDTREQVFGRSGGKPFELTGALHDPGGYETVHYPSFTCGRSSDGGTWLASTGAEWARAKRAGKETPCP